MDKRMHKNQFTGLFEGVEFTKQNIKVIKEASIKSFIVMKKESLLCWRKLNRISRRLIIIKK